ncbi:MAG: patatin-like phospholipase family protein, partial [Terriglobia bacterium]
MPSIEPPGSETGANGHTPETIWPRMIQALSRPARESTPPPHPAVPSGRRIGLALGGGFARGLAHIGVLKVLVENHIPIHAIAGTSVGSIVGAAFASGATPEEMREKARDIRWRSFARWTIHRLGMAKTDRMDEMLLQLFHTLRFEDLAIPLHILATDLVTGEPVIFTNGDLIPAVRGSCSFPGLFVPVEYQGHMLVDGALISSVPAAA